MSFAVSIVGGDANGAWFEGHALPGPPPELIRVAFRRGDSRVALLDLPDDGLEPGEVELRYRRVSVGHVCRRGRGCNAFATYAPDVAEPRRSELVRRGALASLSGITRVVDGGGQLQLQLEFR